MKYYIGIDGGGTKTRFTLCRQDGKIAGSLDGPTCHYLQCGLDGLTDVLRDGLQELLQQATEAENGGSPEIRRIFVGCAGYGDVASEEPVLDGAIAKAVNAVFGETPVPFRAGNDCENALAGALAGKPGINIIAGTGSMGCGINEAGLTLRCGGWHHAIGSDEGSAYWIGWRLLREFQRQSDGRDPKTELYEAIRETLRLRSDDELIRRVVEEWDLNRTKIASLAPVCSALYNKKDPFAISIVQDAAKELADIAIALYDRLGFASEGASSIDPDRPVPVSGTGGVFRIGAPILDPFASILAEHRMEYVPSLYPPDIGSVLLAMGDDHLDPLPRIGS